MCADLYDGVLQSHWDYRFVKPFSWVVSGSSGAGKSRMLLQFIKECQRLVYPPPKKLLVAYKHNQVMYSEFGKYIDTEFMKEPGVPTVSQLNGADILIIDDLMSEMESVIDYFTVHSHHVGVNVIFVTQNFYAKGMRTLSLNSHYLTIYKNPRDSSQIKYLARQLEPDEPKLVTEAYRYCTQKPHGYLHINCRQKCHKFFKYRDNIDADADCSVFVSKLHKHDVITFSDFERQLREGYSVNGAIDILLKETV